MTCGDATGTNKGYLRHKAGDEKPCEQCRLARNAYMRAWHKANPNKKRVYRKRWDAARPTYRREKTLEQYGLTIEARDALLTAQGDCCAVCGTSEPGGVNNAWATDHDHALGPTAVRGILCNACNTKLGLLGDNLDNVREWSTKAIAYLIDYDLRRSM